MFAVLNIIQNELAGCYGKYETKIRETCFYFILKSLHSEDNSTKALHAANFLEEDFLISKLNYYLLNRKKGIHKNESEASRVIGILEGYIDVQNSKVHRKYSDWAKDLISALNRFKNEHEEFHWKKLDCDKSEILEDQISDKGNNENVEDIESLNTLLAFLYKNYMKSQLSDHKAQTERLNITLSFLAENIAYITKEQAFETKVLINELTKRLVENSEMLLPQVNSDGFVDSERTKRICKEINCYFFNKVKNYVSDYKKPLTDLNDTQISTLLNYLLNNSNEINDKLREFTEEHNQDIEPFHCFDKALDQKLRDRMYVDAEKVSPKKIEEIDNNYKKLFEVVDDWIDLTLELKLLPIESDDELHQILDEILLNSVDSIEYQINSYIEIHYSRNELPEELIDNLKLLASELDEELKELSGNYLILFKDVASECFAKTQDSKYKSYIKKSKVTKENVQKAVNENQEFLQTIAQVFHENETDAYSKLSEYKVEEDSSIEQSLLSAVMLSHFFSARKSKRIQLPKSHFFRGKQREIERLVNQLRANTTIDDFIHNSRCYLQHEELSNKSYEKILNSKYKIAESLSNKEQAILLDYFDWLIKLSLAYCAAFKLRYVAHEFEIDFTRVSDKAELEALSNIVARENIIYKLNKHCKKISDYLSDGCEVEQALKQKSIRKFSYDKFIIDKDLAEILHANITDSQKDDFIILLDKELPQVSNQIIELCKCEGVNLLAHAYFAFSEYNEQHSLFDFIRQACIDLFEEKRTNEILDEVFDFDQAFHVCYLMTNKKYFVDILKQAAYMCVRSKLAENGDLTLIQNETYELSDQFSKAYDQELANSYRKKLIAIKDIQFKEYIHVGGTAKDKRGNIKTEVWRAARHAFVYQITHKAYKQGREVENITDDIFEKYYLSSFDPIRKKQKEYYKVKSTITSIDDDNEGFIEKLEDVFSSVTDKYEGEETKSIIKTFVLKNNELPGAYKLSPKESEYFEKFLDTGEEHKYLHIKLGVSKQALGNAISRAKEKLLHYLSDKYEINIVTTFYPERVAKLKRKMISYIERLVNKVYGLYGVELSIKQLHDQILSTPQLNGFLIKEILKGGDISKDYLFLFIGDEKNSSRKRNNKFKDEKSQVMKLFKQNEKVINYA